jgi:hypothetical protein
MIGKVIAAQRLAAQRLGHDRLVVTILAGNQKSQFNVFSPSLGQVSCSGVLGAVKLYVNILCFHKIAPDWVQI